MSQNVQELINQARLKLTTSKLRFFGLCLFPIQIRLYKDKSLSSEGMVYFNREGERHKYETEIHLNQHIIEKPDYNVKNLIDILLHEFNHIIRRHQLRIGKRVPIVWNVACDHIVDKSIKELNNQERLSTPYYKYNIIDEIEYDEEYNTEEKVYNWLWTNGNGKGNKFKIVNNAKNPVDITDRDLNTDQDLYLETQYNKFKIRNDIDSSGINPNDQEQVSLINSNLDNYINQVRTLYNIEKERGTLSNNVKNIFDELLKVKVDWKTLLDKAIKKELNVKADSRNWINPNKYYINSGLYLPGRTKRNNIGQDNNHLILHIDSSGSMSDDDLKKAAYIVTKSIDHFEKVTLIIADVEIHQIKEFEKDEYNEIINYFKLEGIKGRGGTSHKHVFDYIEKYDEFDKLSLVISITDLYSDVYSIYDLYKFVKSVHIIFLGFGHMGNIGGSNMTTILIEEE